MRIELVDAYFKSYSPQHTVSDPFRVHSARRSHPSRVFPWHSLPPEFVIPPALGKRKLGAVEVIQIPAELSKSLPFCN